MKYFNGYIIDNFSTLKSLQDIFGSDKYNSIIKLWGLQKYEEIENIISLPSCGCDEKIFALVEALKTARFYFDGLLKDDLFGIYVGLIPDMDVLQSDTYLKEFYVFRCSNNGRTDIVM